ncbi:LysR substrate-binding domain-containing protein, partial [Novosphingobium resinovorum]|uniref:LysR substrate-binding domain-containing protein n=1 Tax=Novosphingobium resinovorum TaxID=158500 RepID=UPI002ED05D45|nr:LysR substrate-binding domain-containing protein [Novosphingobium resinovorum]
MLEIPLPILFHRQPPSKLAPYESRISPAGNPENHNSAKVVLEDARTVFRSTSIAAQQQAVSGGLGLGMLHTFAAREDPGLVHLLPDRVEARRSYWLAMHKDLQRLPRIRAVIEFLDEIVAENHAAF